MFLYLSETEVEKIAQDHDEIKQDQQKDNKKSAEKYIEEDD